MNEIYLDAHASTPVDRRVLDAMLPYFTEYFGNGNHRNGWRANQALENARTEVAETIGAFPGEVFFTSGATEAVNTGITRLALSFPEKKHVVTQSTEHPAVLETIGNLETKGYSVTYLSVDSNGLIDLEELENSIRTDTLLVAIMLVNNEIGTVQPISQIGSICKGKDTKFFCDMTQGVGWYDIDVHREKVDVASFSGHKIYGPRGIGALYYRGSRGPLFSSLMYGGGQEKGVRPGTVNVPGAVGFGKACSLLLENREQDNNHITGLRNTMLKNIQENIDGVHLNGPKELRHPGNISLRIDGMRSERLIAHLPHLMLSNTSACTGGVSISHVLRAVGLDDTQAEESFRIGIGKNNTFEEIAQASDMIIQEVNRVRKQTPVLS